MVDRKCMVAALWFRGCLSQVSQRVGHSKNIGILHNKDCTKANTEKVSLVFNPGERIRANLYIFRPRAHLRL